MLRYVRFVLAENFLTNTQQLCAKDALLLHFLLPTLSCVTIVLQESTVWEIKKIARGVIQGSSTLPTGLTSAMTVIRANSLDFLDRHLVLIAPRALSAKVVLVYARFVALDSTRTSWHKPNVLSAQLEHSHE